MTNDTVLNDYVMSQSSICKNADTSKMKRREIKRVEWDGTVSDITPTRGDIGINRKHEVFSFGDDGKWHPYSFSFNW